MSRFPREGYSRRILAIISICSFGLIWLFVRTHSDLLQLMEENATESLAHMHSRIIAMKKRTSIEIDAINGISVDALPGTHTHDELKDELKGTNAIVSKKRRSGRLKVGFVITITKDGNFGDGAAVLAYSIIKNSQQLRTPAGSRVGLRGSTSVSPAQSAWYDISLVALVHPLVRQREALRRLGYQVIEVPLPVNVSAIRGNFLREKINKNGCCGASELIKLSSYRLTQFDRVVHLDADTFINKPIDELLLPASQGGLHDYSLLYTTDPNMATHKGEDMMPAQGGFLVMKPSETDFRLIIDTLMTTEYKQGGAWNGSKIGWFWGGMTVQGIIPYYYNRVSREMHHNETRREIIDRCVYNTMADSDACRMVPLDEVRSAHFTICQKPWTCHKWGGHAPVCKMPMCNPLCKALHEEWFSLRRAAERFYGIPETDVVCPQGGVYVPMSLSGANMHGGENQFPVMPVVETLPALIKPPKPESGYRLDTEEWDNFVGGHVPGGGKRDKKGKKG
eukprot:GSChrysophyteH1.ASY1.ANO1.1338.1 assembled CDS